MQAKQALTIDVHQLSERLAMQPPVCLLDVREKDEWEICCIDGAALLPMSEIDQRFRDLDSERETVVYCHHGIRSLRVAQFLVANGFKRVVSLAGGIDAWSAEIDPSVLRYGVGR